jgi:poly-gamma-glutamate system protein
MVVIQRPCLRLVLLALVNLACVMLCQQALAPAPGTGLECKREAVALVEKAHKLLESRLIGPEYTPITTTLAPLPAKRLSLHPDFAAVAVHLLMEAGIRAGDAVALNLSGSFPGLNIAVLAAVQAIGAKPISVSSVGASTWGATDPEDTWLDLEHALVDAGIWPWRSAAASLGGFGDRGGGLGEEGMLQAKQAIERAGIEMITPATLEEAIAQRVAIFMEETGVLPPVLVNVGGGHVFFGSRGHRAPLKQGLNHGYQSRIAAPSGLAALFLDSNRPVIHFINIAKMAREYGIGPESPVGSSKVFYPREVPNLNRWLVLFWLAVVLPVMWYGGTRGWWRE